MDIDRVAVNLPTNALPRRWRVGLAMVPVAFLLVFYAWPVATLVGRVVRPRTIDTALGRPDIGSILCFTIWQATVSTALTMVVGMAPAYLLARRQFPGRRLLGALVVVPFLLPTVVVGAAFSALLPRALLGTVVAVLIAHVYFNVSVVVRLVGTLWAQIPVDLGAAARTLGAGPWQTARLVTLPLLRPSLFAAATVTFLFTFTSYGVVQILGGPRHPTLEVEIARRATQLGDVGGAAVLSLVQLVALVCIVAVSARAQRRSGVTLAANRVPAARAGSARSRIGVGLLAAATALFVLVPLASLAVTSLHPGTAWSLSAWRALFGGGDIGERPGAAMAVDAWAAIGESARTALFATVISVAIGGLATLAIGAAQRRGRFLDVGLMLPLGTSAVTIGFGMLITFDHAPFDWRGEPWLVPLGHALIAVPFVVRAALPVLRARPREWLDAAATLGASPTRAWWEIDVALLMRPLLVGAGFAAAISLGEFGATTLLSRAGHETLPLAIGRLLGRAGDLPRAEACALSVVLAAVTMVIMLAINAGSEGGDARRS